MSPTTHITVLSQPCKNLCYIENRKRSNTNASRKNLGYERWGIRASRCWIGDMHTYYIEYVISVEESG